MACRTFPTRNWPVPLAVEVCSVNHLTARNIPVVFSDMRRWRQRAQFANPASWHPSRGVVLTCIAYLLACRSISRNWGSLLRPQDGSCVLWMVEQLYRKYGGSFWQYEISIDNLFFMGERPLLLLFLSQNYCVLCYKIKNQFLLWKIRRRIEV